MRTLLRVSVVSPLVVIASACGGVQDLDAPPVVEASLVCPECPACEVPEDDGHANLNAVLWTQTSAEYAAVTMQAYRSAIALLPELADNRRIFAAPEQTEADRGAEPAVILDLDETVLDNSAYQAWLIENDRHFATDTWEAWCAEGAATAIPGAIEFVNEANDIGVNVFFVTNRSVACEEATIANLEALGFETDADHVFVQGEVDSRSEKSARRAAIAEENRIVMLVGDNLGDFTDDYRGTVEERAAIVEENANRWGRTWIMLPNPQYGSWERAAIRPTEGQGAMEAAREALDAWEGSGE
jgi:acid phosphatase